ncbi:MAG: CcoQ/FixQ family Cbb3-type cytochrome c oxidase assembly chaperone [Thermoanaerobaculia bacterium]|nr:CcoQ/FixQ family Cbb3-type cytochrome c oxidase assembly chaperone [Thermoanaerobaculia bacterium]
MDAVLMQNIFTLASAACYVGIIAWAWSRRVKPEFEEAERLPFAEELPASGLARSTK